MKVTCKYETIDGQIFHDKYDAIKHEISLYPSFEIPAKMRHMCNNNFRLTWFNTPADANDSDDRVEWEGKGYYYFVVNCYPQTEDYGYYDDCDQTVVKTWRRFTDDMKDFIFELDSLRIRAVDAELSR